jgi:hypothetical protein
MDTATAIRRLQLHARYAEEDVGQLTDLLGTLLDELDDDERRAVLRHAYWRMPEVPTAALVAVGGGAGPLRRAVGRGPVIGTCAACGRVLRALVRDDVDLVASGPCTGCRTRRSRPTADRARPGFTWEFGGQPQPWRPTPLPRAAAGRRRWAEDYPDARPA